LQRIQITGDDEAEVPRLFSLGDEGTDDVVRFKALIFKDRNPEGLEDFLDQRELGAEVFRCCGPVGLVGCSDRVPEGEPSLVEGRHHTVGRDFFKQLQKHPGEAVDCVGGQTFSGAERRDGVKSSVGQTVSVKQDYPLQPSTAGLRFYSLRPLLLFQRSKQNTFGIRRRKMGDGAGKISAVGNIL